MDIPRNPLYPQRMLSLLDQHAKKEITLAQLLTECAYWAIEPAAFDELIPIAYPYEPTTQTWRDYKSMPEHKRLQLKTEYYKDNPEIEEYLNRKHSVFNKNRENHRWLREVLSYIPENDTINRTKVMTKINQFVLFERSTKAGAIA